jgi:hypothetical protein
VAALKKALGRPGTPISRLAVLEVQRQLVSPGFREVQKQELPLFAFPFGCVAPRLVSGAGSPAQRYERGWPFFRLDLTTVNQFLILAAGSSVFAGSFSCPPHSRIPNRRKADSKPAMPELAL